MANSNENTHVIVQYEENEKKIFSVIMANDIFLNDDDEEILIEQSYQFRLKRKKGYAISLGIVKYKGSKNLCDKNLNKISSYTKYSPQKKTKNSSSKSSISVSRLTCHGLINDTRQKVSFFDNDKKDVENTEEEDNKCHNNNEFERKLIERDEYIIELKQKLENKEKENSELIERMETYRQLTDTSFIQKILPVCVQMLKYLGSEKEYEEVRKFGTNSTEILVHQNHQGIFMHKNLFNRIKIMIEQKQSGTSIFRVMAKALVPDTDAWAKSTGSKMDQNNQALRAARDFLLDQNIGFNESMYKLVLRGICSECKSETEKK